MAYEQQKQQDPYLSAVRRMGGLQFTPQTAEGWAELAKVLKRRSKDVEHARRIIDRFLEPGPPERCPTPGELAAVAAGVPADARLDRPELAPPCEECAPYSGNFRWVRGGLKRCDCARGLKLAAMDEARNRTETKVDAEPRKAAHEHPADADWMRRASGEAE